MLVTHQTRRTAAAAVVAIGLALVPMAMAQPVQARTVIRVTTRADTLASDGRCSLREAVRAANTDRPIGGCPAGDGADTIVVPRGRYLLTTPGRGEDLGSTGDLDVWSDVTIRGKSAAATIIDGNELDRVFDILAGARVALDALSISHGSASERDGTVPPGGPSDGGGIANRGDLLITASIIDENATGGWAGGGGGVFSSGTLTMRNTTVSHNRAYEGSGGISATGDAFLMRVRVIENQGGHYTTAGGIDSTGYLVLSNSLVSGNRGSNEWGHGGVTMLGGVIRDSTIRDNDGSECGSGGVVMVGALMDRSTVSGNADGTNCPGTGAGGVLAIDSEIVNSTISGNVGGDGRVGGVLSDGSVIVNSTITGNRSRGNPFDVGPDPGGLGSVDGSQTILRNTIVAGNLGPDGGEWDCAGVITSERHNLIGSVAGCTFEPRSSDMIGVDPLLGPLADNGGPTFTHMLRPGSPAIDAWYDGALAPGGSCPTLDQRGVRRPQDADGDGRPGCDIGSVERLR